MSAKMIPLKCCFMNEIYDLKQENSSARSLLKHESFNHSINNDCAKEEESTNEELGTIMPASLGNNCTNFEPVSLWNNRSSLTLEQATQWFLGTILPVSFGNNPTNTPLYSTLKRPFPRRFNVEYKWCVCRELYQ